MIGTFLNGILNFPAISLASLSNRGTLTHARVIKLCLSYSDAGPPDSCNSTTTPKSESAGHLKEKKHLLGKHLTISSNVLMLFHDN